MHTLEEKLKETLGDDESIQKGLASIRPLLEGESIEKYLRLVEMFSPFDPSFARWLLRSGGEVFSTIGTPAARQESIELLLGLGREKWSVAALALRKIPELRDTESGFMLSWLEHGRAIAAIDQDAAIEYFTASPETIGLLGTDGFDEWAAMGCEITGLSWKAAKAYFKSSPEAIQKLEYCDVPRWARLGVYLIRNSPKIKASYDAQSMLAAGAAAGKGRKVDLAVQYFKSAPQVLGRLSINDLEEWVEKGLETTDAQKDKGKAFFSLETGKSRRAVEGLVKGLELIDVHIVLRAYAEALTGKRVLLRSSALFYRNLPGLSRFLTMSDGARVFLPSKITVFEDDEKNFKAYKLSLAHELAHLRFGTFDIGTEEIRRLSGFRDPALAFKIFEFLEDERVDYLMGLEFPGLEKDRNAITTAFLEQREDSGVGRSASASSGERAAGDNGSGPGKGLLETLLSEAAVSARRVETTVLDVLDLTRSLCTTLEEQVEGAVCRTPESSERMFYRGILDFELVEKTGDAVKRLVLDLVDLLADKGEETDPERVQVALDRMEETAGLEEELSFWQTDDSEKMEMLLDQIRQTLADMEAEKHFRRSVYYDEWDYQLDDYKKEWCRVREMDMPETRPVFYNETIREHYGLVSLLRRHFGLLRPDRIKRFFREERGDDIDYEALIESIVDRHAGVTPSDRVYIRREKNLRDVSVAFLVDMSYSTGDELPSGKRIIDIEKEGLVLMAEALESIGDQWAVYGFSTNRRDKVDFHVVRDFDMAFGDGVKMRFENIRPLAQTRLGAAIRHTTRLLGRQTSRIKLLILLSDGRPYDIDYGDADYAVEDTRRAVWEGRKKGVTFYCITVDKRSREYLPHMYGESNFTLIDHVDALPAMLPLIYKRLTT